VSARSGVAFLGIDVEEVSSVCNDLEGLSALIAQPGELDRMGRLPAALAVTVLFSAKESLYKALYPEVREFQDFYAAQVIELVGNRLRLRLNKDWGGQMQAGSELHVSFVHHDSHVVTACIAPLPAK
jgi:enterobactin synthetase component D